MSEELRYEARWRNGIWTIFDRLAYAPFDYFDTQKAAVNAADWCNTPGNGY